MNRTLLPPKDARRILFNVPLQPVQGTRFQPTGFPDLGAATYQAGDTDCLLVESAQSMANRLEAQIWDDGTQALREPFKGLSYVRVTAPDGKFLTASCLEAHRLNSAYIEKSEGPFFSKDLVNMIGVDKKKPIDRTSFTRAVLLYDANALLHGLFLESLDGRLRIARAVSAFIEAHHVGVAASGGVKNDRVQAETKSEKDEDGKKKGGAGEGFGNVPFHREEFVAREIVAYVNLDQEQLRGYGLPEVATDLLLLLALYKVRSLFDGGLRLRTACDLAVDPGYAFKAEAPAAYTLPPVADLEAAIRARIKDCAEAGLFGGEHGVTTVSFSADAKGTRKSGKKDTDEPDSDNA